VERQAAKNSLSPIVKRFQLSSEKAGRFSTVSC